MIIQERDYQIEAEKSVFDYWADGGGNPLVEMATGTGKSVVIAKLNKRLLTDYPGLRVLMLTHVRELVAQNMQALIRVWPEAPVGINSAGLNRRDYHSHILFASIQSVYKRGGMLGARDVVMVDEAHLVPRDGDGMYRTLLKDLRRERPDLRVVGFTATPYRLDSGRLDEGDETLFSEIVYSYDLARAVADGWLAPLVSKATKTEIDVRGVRRKGGEFAAGELEAAADIPAVVQGAADEMVQHGEGRKGWLAFCSGIKHAMHVRDALRQRGVKAEMVTGETPSGERDSIIRGFRNGQIQCLTNAMVLTTGFDVPHVDMIGLLRPTLSTGLYVQSLGRGTRLAPDKTNCLVLDFAGNVRRHGPVDAVMITTSKKNGKDKPEKTDPDTVRAKVCPMCQTYNSISAPTCIACGHEWPAPGPKHTAEAEIIPIMTRDIVNKWTRVDDVRLDRHRKFGDGPDSMLVEFVCGPQTFKQWICVEHTGYAREKAEFWWLTLGGQRPPPKKIDDALERAAELHMPTGVTVKRDDKYWRIASIRAERPDGTTIEIEQERFRVREVTA